MSTPRHPISLNVIRQALCVAGAPKPRRIETLDQARFPTDTVVTAYKMEFSFHEIMGQANGDLNAPHERVEAAVKRINDCFCEDIFVTDYDYEPRFDAFTMTVCTRLVAQRG